MGSANEKWYTVMHPLIARANTQNDPRELYEKASNNYQCAVRPVTY